MSDIVIADLEPPDTVLAGELAVDVAGHTFERREGPDDLDVFAEFSTVTADGSQLVLLCSQSAVQDVGDASGLSMAEDSTGRAECGSFLAQGDILWDALFDVPDDPGSQVHFGMRVWSERENPPPYVAPDGAFFDNSVAWTVDIIQAFDPGAVNIENCHDLTTPLEPGQQGSVSVDVSNGNIEAAEADLVVVAGGAEIGRRTVVIDGDATTFNLIVEFTAPSTSGDFNIAVDLENVTVF